MTRATATPPRGAALRRDPRFGSFVALFNAGKFFAAHEALEALWLDVEGPERDFLQGLVQIAVALEHRARGNAVGAGKVLARASRRLRGYGPSHAGLPLRGLLAHAQALVEGARRDLPRLPAAPAAARAPRSANEVQTMKRSGRARSTPAAAGKGAEKKDARSRGNAAAPRAGKAGEAGEKPAAVSRRAAAAASASLAKSRRRAAEAKRAAGSKRAARGRARDGDRTKARLVRGAGRASAIRGKATASLAARRLEPLEVRRSRALAILEGLRRLYPDARCELTHGSALELLVATILSAQCTDARVNMTTPALFARYRTAADYASADLGEVGELIRSTGFFNNKAKSIVSLGKALIERHGGEVPRTMDELVTLPGVGRKTANVLLAEWFHQPGIAVDTHVIRLTGPVWRLTNETDPVKIEFALYELIPEPDRSFFGIATIFHGRRICTARRPDCAACALNTICPSAFRLGVRTAV